MISDVFNEAYLVRGVDAHLWIDAHAAVLESDGAFFEPGRAARFAAAIPILAATMRPTVEKVRSVILRFTKRTVVVVFVNDGFLAISARPEAPLKKLRSTAVRIAKTIDGGAVPAQRPTPPPRAGAVTLPGDASPKKRTKLGIWD